MARLVKLDATGPFKIEPKDFPTDGKAIWICMCGLSKTMPYCDKNHKACKSEEAGYVYRYDPVTGEVVGREVAIDCPPPPAPLPPS